MNLPAMDIWWKLTLPVEELCVTILDVIKKYGVPYLDQFLTLDDIIDQWKEHGASIGLPPRADLSVAIMLASQGKMDNAGSLLKMEYDEAHGHPYAQLIIETAKKSLGL